jgi:Family of unknown function (DUF6232)
MHATHATAGSAMPTSPGPVGPTYYLDPDIQVTQRRLYVQGAQLTITDLDNLSMSREPCPTIGLVAGLVAATSLVVLAAGLASGTGPLAIVAGIGVVAGASMAALAWHGRRYQLWATYHGVDVRLYRCQDRVKFGKVTRAIVRARRPVD